MSPPAGTTRDGVAGPPPCGPPVAWLEELAEGVPVPARVGSLQLVLVRQGSGVRAYDRACPHEQADLARGHCVDGRLHCPRHRASFCLDDGGISAGWGGCRLRRHAVEVVEGMVFVSGASRRAL